MIIAGAGMAGLVAGHMLRRYSPTIWEAQSSLPNNHAAVLRFRSPAVGEATGIPFTPVSVRKALYRNGGLRDCVTLADNNEYSFKVTGEVRDRSVLNLEPVTRWIAPANFIALLAPGLNIAFDATFGLNQLDHREGEPTISTIPMPVIVKMIGKAAPAEGFRWTPIWTLTMRVEEPSLNVYQTIYYPELNKPYYRATLTGDRLAVEYSKKVQDYDAVFHAQTILGNFGITSGLALSPPEFKRQEYGKLLPTSEQYRREFIMEMTDRYNFWSLGRFATWRQILLDDIVKDVRFIDRVLSTRDHYTRRLS